LDVLKFYIGILNPNHLVKKFSLIFLILKTKIFNVTMKLKIESYQIIKLNTCEFNFIMKLVNYVIK
jgi:hypothetical protein